MAGKSKRTPAYKSVSTPYNVADAISEAFAEFQALRDEMTETRDNLSSANMEHLPKYETANAAADALDSFADNEPDVPECANELSCTVTVQRNARKGRGESRDVRCGNASSMLQAAVDALEEEMDRLQEVHDKAERTERAEEDEAENLEVDANEREIADPPDHEEAGNFRDEAAEHLTAANDARLEKEQAESDKGELEELKDALESVLSECDGIEFPGFYG